LLKTDFVRDILKVKRDRGIGGTGEGERGREREIERRKNWRVGVGVCQSPVHGMEGDRKWQYWWRFGWRIWLAGQEAGGKGCGRKEKRRESEARKITARNWDYVLVVFGGERKRPGRGDDSHCGACAMGPTPTTRALQRGSPRPAPPLRSPVGSASGEDLYILLSRGG
jgi:hypothetical protein